ncbi:hypothetical protein MUK72_07685 [Halococcus dombrowskii]|uniref:Uncharacterized protein n=1 Tax=Halococcus dombrowskii TaxID=179637 RepID=A0AAV3SGB2_HALDO|nr:hypothetical protein [Halococcus dombrowskii]UOO93854.1 hypothetical protein MUK72_07685 [Halococcus dombrowskii]
MELTHDELAGIVDLFGALSLSELATAGDELAFKRGTELAGPDVDAALAAYRLVAFDPDAITDRTTDEQLLAAGPTAFPALPDGAEDLPHILDVDACTPDRAALGAVVEERFRADAARAVAEDDHDRIARLLDVSYDLETWAPVALDGVRDRLDTAAGD